MIEIYWREEIVERVEEWLEDEDLQLTPDYSQFNVVDGEEGDYGIIHYYDPSERLFAIKTVYGGDSEDLKFTPYGESVMHKRVKAVIEKVLDWVG